MKNRVEISDEFGVRVECLSNYWERFEKAFYTMIQEFIDTVIDKRSHPFDIRDAIEATRTATAFTTSFKEKRAVKVVR